MTISTARRLLKDAIRSYNCTDWNVKIAVADFLGEGIEDVDGNILWRQDGTCHSIWRYKQAQIQVGEHLDDKEVAYVIRHEAAHVLLAEMHDVFERIQQLIPEKNRGVAYELFMDAEEHTCDRLAKAPFHSKEIA